MHPPSPPQPEHPPAPCASAGSPTPKARRRLSGFGVSPNAVEMRTQDQPAARASCTAFVSAVWARWRAFTALRMNSSTGAVMPDSMARYLRKVEGRPRLLLCRSQGVDLRKHDARRILLGSLLAPTVGPRSGDC